MLSLFVVGESAWAQQGPATSSRAGLATIDWMIIVVYALGTIGLGWYYSRRQSSTKEYFVGTGNMNPVLIGVSLFATLLSTISYLSMPGESLGKGPMYMLSILAVPAVFGFVGFVLLPVYMKQRVTSAYELLETNLGPGNSDTRCADVCHTAARVDVTADLHDGQSHDHYDWCE